MHAEPPPNTMMKWLIAALAAWGLLLGIGAYLGLDAQTPSRDYRRMLIVAATIGGFLLLWLAAVAKRKNRRK